MGTLAAAHGKRVGLAGGVDGPLVGQAVTGNAVGVEGERVELEGFGLRDDDITGVVHREGDHFGVVVDDVEGHATHVVGALLVHLTVHVLNETAGFTGAGIPSPLHDEFSVKGVLADHEGVLAHQHDASGANEVVLGDAHRWDVGTEELVGAVGGLEPGGAGVLGVGGFGAIRTGDGEDDFPVVEVGDVRTAVLHSGVDKGRTDAEVGVHAVANHHRGVAGAVRAVALSDAQCIDADVVEGLREAVNVVTVGSSVVVVAGDRLAEVRAARFTGGGVARVVEPRLGALVGLAVLGEVEERCFDGVLAVGVAVRRDGTAEGPFRLVGDNLAAGFSEGVVRGVAGHLNGLGAAGHEDPRGAVRAEVHAARAGRRHAAELEGDVHFTWVELGGAVRSDGELEGARVGVRTDRSVVVEAAVSVGPAQVDLDVGPVADDDEDLLFVVGGVAVVV